jgi:hypothetical protein
MPFKGFDDNTLIIYSSEGIEAGSPWRPSLLMYKLASQVYKIP